MEEFEAGRDARMGENARFALGMLSAPELKPFHDFDTYADFLLQLPRESFDLRLIEAFFDSFLRMLEAVHTTPSSEFVDIFYRSIGPWLSELARWSSSMADSQRLILIQRLESTLARNTDDLVTRGNEHTLKPEQVQFFNAAVAAYLLSTMVFRTSVSVVALSALIRLKRYSGVVFWSKLPFRTRIDHALVSLYVLISYAPIDDKFRTSQGMEWKSFSEVRDILVEAREGLENSEHTIEGVVFDWFISKINQDVLFVEQDFKDPEILLRALSKGEHGIIQDLAQRFHSYKYPVTIERIYAFLAQFPSLDMMKVVIRLLTHVRYIPLSRLSELVEDSLLAMPQSRKSRRVVPLGDLDGSTSIVRYLASHSKRLGPNISTSSLEEALDETGDEVELLFADDCCLSGTQGINTFEEFLGLRKLKAHHTRLTTKLSSKRIRALRKRKLKFCFAIATPEGLKRMQKRLTELGLGPTKMATSQFELVEQKLFSPYYSWLWRSNSEMESCKQFFTKVGQQILTERACKKHWKPERLEKSALGFGDHQRLLVFEHNVPKSTITALWESGEFNGKDWIPLFPGSG